MIFFETKGSVEKLHLALDEIGYQKKENLNFSDFLNQTKKTLTRTSGTFGMSEILEWFNLASDNWQMLESLARGTHKHSEYFKSLPFRGNEILELLNDEDCEGATVITNALTKDPKEINVFDSENSYTVKRVDGAFRFVDDDDWEYYVQPTFLKSYKFSFCKRDGKKLFQMTCNDDLDIYLTNNNTSLDILIDEENDVVVIADYSRPKDEQEIAYIYSDIIGKGNKYGACQIYPVAEMDGSTWELCLLIAMCTFFIYNAKIQTDTMAMAWFLLN